MSQDQIPAPEMKEFLGVGFTDMPLDEALSWLRGRNSASPFAYVVTPNVDHILNLTQDSQLRKIYEQADLCLCDSRVLALLARLARVNLRVSPGSELTSKLLRRMEAHRSICVIASRHEVAQRLREALPDVDVYIHVPPLGLRHDTAAQQIAVNFIRQLSVDYIFLAVGSPQQELIANLLRSDGRIKGTALCVGAALSFFTGDARRAPAWVQRMALEWAYRLIQEPRRLAYRYLIRGPAIVLIYGKWVWRQRGSVRPSRHN